MPYQKLLTYFDHQLLMAEIKEALAKKYPQILWSDSEFETNNQNSVEFQGEYWVCIRPIPSRILSCYRE